MYSWHSFSPILWVVSSIYRPFHLWSKSFLISCSLICQSFLLVVEPFEFYLGRHCLCLLIPFCSCSFSALASKFHHPVKVSTQSELSILM
jgi:hypothetical protein